MFKFFYTILTNPLGLPIDPLWEYIILLIVGEIVHEIAWNTSPGGSLGSLIYWGTKCISFIVIWAVLYVTVIIINFISLHWIWFLIGISSIVMLMVFFLAWEKRGKIKMWEHKASRIIKKFSFSIKKRVCNLFWHLKTALTFPHIWISAIILLLAGITLWLSFELTLLDKAYWSSIFANIFAGLVTGFVLCLVSGAKQIAITKMREKKAWLDNLANMLKDYFSGYQQLQRMKFQKFDGNEDTFKFIYDIGSHANWVNDEILQSSFNKVLPFDSIKYSKRYLGYDALSLCSVFEELHGNLYSLDVDYPSSKQILAYFDSVTPALRSLNTAVLAATRSLDIRLSEIQKTIV